MADSVAIETGTPPVGQGSSSIETQSTSQPTPETYTKQEYMRAITSERKKQSGLDKEVARLQTLVDDKDSELKELADERIRLQADIDALASDDPNKFNLIKKEREVRELERQSKAEIAKNKERIKKAEEFERKELVQTIVEGYEGGDAKKLLRLCDIANVDSEDQIRELADTEWTRKTVESTSTGPGVLGVKPDSGRTSGGGMESFTHSQVNELRAQVANENDPVKRAALVKRLDAAWRSGRIHE